MAFTKQIYIYAIAILACTHLVSQTTGSCLEEIIALDKKMDVHADTAMRTKNISLEYSVRITDWDNEVTISNVKIHKLNGFVHFFSEQASIYQDESEVVIIMPLQRIAIINSTNKELANRRVGDDFYEMRRRVLDSCKVIKCEIIGSKKVTELKVNRSAAGTQNMVSMTYEYNSNLEKIYSVKSAYDQDYKIKYMHITYKDLNVNASSKFYPARTYLLDKGGKLLAKYKGYELVDNRDSKRKKKK